MFIEITATGVPGFASGSVVDVPDGVGRAYVEANQAKASDAMSYLRGSMSGIFAERDAALKTQLDDIKTTLRSSHSATAPGGNPGVEITPEQLRYLGTNVVSPADRGKKGTSDVLRMIGIASLGEEDHKKVAQTRLKEIYGCTRSIFDAVARDGSESLGTAQTYGYLVRPEWLPEVFAIMQEESVMTGIKSIPVGNAVSIRMPALDQYSNPGAKTSAYFGGVSLYRTGEATARTTSDATLDEIEFKITDLTGMTKVSRDLLADSYIPLDAYLGQLFGKAFAWRKDYDYILGNGVGEPLGFRNSGALGTVTRNTTAHIYYEDLVGMLAKLHPACWSGCRWICNVTTITELAAVKNAGGTYVYQPNSMVNQAMYPLFMSPQNNLFNGTLLGYPVYFTEKVPPMGTAGDINLINPQSYCEVIKGGVEVAVSEHRYFETDQIAYRWKLRHDAKPLWRSTFKSADGSNTALSPFVAIA